MTFRKRTNNEVWNSTRKIEKRTDCLLRAIQGSTVYHWWRQSLSKIMSHAIYKFNEAFPCHQWKLEAKSSLMMKGDFINFVSVSTFFGSKFRTFPTLWYILFSILSYCCFSTLLTTVQSNVMIIGWIHWNHLSSSNCKRRVLEIDWIWE
jgi:hypothetical protein